MNFIKSLVLWGLVAVGLAFTADAASAAQVKKSNSGICHDRSSPWYDRTEKYSAFPSVASCLASGGRLPAGKQAHPSTIRSAQPSPPGATVDAYDRDTHFGGWEDADGNCLNTRHEVLAAVSTGPIHREGCRITQGRWNDPYTGKIFTRAADLDIDHLVPLKWAWDRGANRWSDTQRRAFANDPRNLFATEASVNRAKGSRGPLEWLPPNASFHCEYVLRFERIARIYNLSIPMHEQTSMARLQTSLCQK